MARIVAAFDVTSARARASDGLAKAIVIGRFTAGRRDPLRARETSDS